MSNSLSGRAAVKRKRYGRLLAVLLSAAMLLSIPVPAAAAEANTPKQEVVYIGLTSDGSVDSIYVVNIFELDEDGKIIDYGDYTALRNMTTDDEIGFENGMVTIDAQAGKLYYEGTLESSAIPWEFSIRYYLNGVEYSAQELAGKSGALKIMMAVRQNAACTGTFFENYSIQATVTLDTAICKNIAAEGATAANVGAQRQLTYTILAGSEKDIAITADVTDFEMDGIELNGIPLSLDVELDTNGNTALGERLTELESAVSELDNGAGEVKDGAEKLLGGAQELADGAAALKTGAENAAQGALSLYNGAAELSSGADSLTSGAAALSGGLEQLAGRNTAVLESAYTVFQQLAAQAEQQLNFSLAAAGMPAVELTTENYAAVLSGVAEALSAGGSDASMSVLALKGQLDGYNDFYLGLREYTGSVASAADGAEALSGGVSELAAGARGLCAGEKSLYDGLASVQTGSETLCAGAAELRTGAEELCDGTAALAGGTAEFCGRTAELGPELQEGITAAVSEMLGGEFETESFASNKNTNIEAVQFVMKTDGVKVQAAAAAQPAVEPELTFWQKLLRLFGID